MRRERISSLQIGPLALCMVMLLLALTTLATQSAVAASLQVEESSGAVKLRMQEKWQSPAPGMNVALPAVVSTGSDGVIKLRQGDTLISVASNTALEFFADAEGDSILQRVVQSQGSAFYDVAPRESNKLRVETPYLVAVIKGTEFDVTVANETTSVSLFEGHLQIEAPDIGDVVQLSEGQIARRHKDDQKITVLSMQDGQPIARSDARPGSQGASGDDPTSGSVSSGTSTSTGLLNVGVDTSQGAGSVSIDNTINLQLPGSGISAGAGLEATLGVGKLELGSELGATLPGAELDLGVAAGTDLLAGELDLGADAGLDLGPLALDTGIDAGIDLGAGEVDLDIGVDAGIVELELVELDLDLGLGVDPVDLLNVEIDDLLDPTETESLLPLDVVEDLLPGLGGLIGG